MRFGAIPLDRAAGAILAHSVSLPDGKLRKGDRLTAATLERLRAAGIAEVMAAELEPGDVHEDEAAARVAAALAPEPALAGLTVSAPFTGRVNLFAAHSGLASIDASLINRLNAIDEAVTVATLEDRCRVSDRQMVATVKIIPYAAPLQAVEAAERLAGEAKNRPALTVQSPTRRTADLILTRTPGMKASLLTKGADAVRQRLAALGVALAAEKVVPHETAPLADALVASNADIALVLTASATSDRADVGPSAVIAAGGRIERFGMPVDPGNLLFLGGIGSRPVIGLPGCARSPKLNGADWVLERVACGLDPSAEEIAAMGVGGLLKEIPSRPTPRTGPMASARPRIGAVVLAAGASARMGGRDKLIEDAGGMPLLTRVLSAVGRSAIDETVVVLRPDDAARTEALADSGARIVRNSRAAEGMGTSIAAGVRALSPGLDGALIVMGDMPEIGPADIDRLTAAFDAAEDREIIRARTEDGRPGHPILFGRRFFEALRMLDGDIGARALVAEHPEFLVEVPLPGLAALTDLDTPEDWRRWRAVSGG